MSRATSLHQFAVEHPHERNPESSEHCSWPAFSSTAAARPWSPRWSAAPTSSPRSLPCSHSWRSGPF